MLVKKRLVEYVDKITNMRRYFMFMSKNSNYEITLTEATELFKKTENPQSLIDDNPYKALYTICDRKFVEVDSMIVHFRPELKSSELRCEYLMIYLLTLNENDGNTRIYAPKLASVVNQWDSGLVARMKIVAVNSSYIHYDEGRNSVALGKTERYER